MAKRKDKQGAKALRKGFEKIWPQSDFDYRGLTRLYRPRALLRGVAVSSLIYIGGFSVFYYFWSMGKIHDDILFKTSWILLIPAMVAGFVVTQISKNRQEYPVRTAMKQRIQDIEADGGRLWRYAPLLGDVMDLDTKAAIAASRRGQSDQDIEAYCSAVMQIHAVWSSANRDAVSDEMLQQLSENLSPSPGDPV